VHFVNFFFLFFFLVGSYGWKTRDYMEQGDGKGDEIDQGLLLAPFFILVNFVILKKIVGRDK